MKDPLEVMSRWLFKKVDIFWVIHFLGLSERRLGMSHGALGTASVKSA